MCNLISSYQLIGQKLKSYYFKNQLYIAKNNRIYLIVNETYQIKFEILFVQFASMHQSCENCNEKSQFCAKIRRKKGTNGVGKLVNLA